METMYLMGSEDVKSAGIFMKEAASAMQTAANQITEALDRHSQFMDAWLVRLEVLLEDQIKP